MINREAESSIPELDELRRIRLVNYIGFLAIGNMFLYMIGYSILDFDLFKFAIIFLSVSSIIILGVILINIKGFHLLAKILLAVLIPASMGYVVIVIFGTGPGFQVYLLVTAIIPLFLWSQKQRQYPLVIIVLILMVYTYTEFFLPVFHPKISLSEYYIFIFRKTNVTVCFVAAGFAIGFYQNLYRLQEKQLIAKTEELKLSQAHKDKIYSIIAHDLRSPIGSIVNLTGLVAEKGLVDDKHRNIVQMTHNSMISLQNLLENLLQWSRTQTGTIGKAKSQINLLQIVNESAAPYKDNILKKELKVNIEINSNDTVYANRHMISTVFRNLLSNAIKFSKKKGEITISSKENMEEIQICIKDNGVGISEEDIKYLFDIRYIDKLSIKSPEKGSGLGLLLCKDFIDGHNGRLWAESEIEKGSSFYFTLPKSDTDL